MTLSCKINIKMDSLLNVVLHALGRQRQVELCEFKDNVVYVASTSQSELHREALSQKQNNKDL